MHVGQALRIVLAQLPCAHFQEGAIPASTLHDNLHCICNTLHACITRMHSSVTCRIPSRNACTPLSPAGFHHELDALLCCLQDSITKYMHPSVACRIPSRNTCTPLLPAGGGARLLWRGREGTGTAGPVRTDAPAGPPGHRSLPECATNSAAAARPPTPTASSPPRPPPTACLAGPAAQPAPL